MAQRRSAAEKIVDEMDKIKAKIEAKNTEIEELQEKCDELSDELKSLQVKEVMNLMEEKGITIDKLKDVVESV